MAPALPWHRGTQKVPLVPVLDGGRVQSPGRGADLAPLVPLGSLWSRIEGATRGDWRKAGLNQSFINIERKQGELRTQKHLHDGSVHTSIGVCTSGANPLPIINPSHAVEVTRVIGPTTSSNSSSPHHSATGAGRDGLGRFSSPSALPQSMGKPLGRRPHPPFRPRTGQHAPRHVCVVSARMRAYGTA